MKALLPDSVLILGTDSNTNLHDCRFLISTKNTCVHFMHVKCFLIAFILSY